VIKRVIFNTVLLLGCLSLSTGVMSAADKKAPATDAKKTSNLPVVTIELKNGGIIKYEMYADTAPKTVARMTELIQKGFYDGLNFHRVEPGFVVQGGDPAGNGTGGTGVKLPAEFNERKHLTGTVAMARSQDPNSADCQFYICLGAAPFLDRNYTVFGQVIEGMDVVKKIKVGDVMKKVTVVIPGKKVETKKIEPKKQKK
jgi:cyclophilin family peptidyl-prolyl cis-trans isomerase